MMIDTHCHLDEEYYSNLDDVIKNMELNIMIVSGVNTSTNKHVIELCNKYPNVYGVIGFHPEEVDNFNEDDLIFIENNINNPKIVGIGEIGLDYYWNKENKVKQQEIFIKQLQLAKKYNKPVVIHSRDAINDTYNILKNEVNGDLKIVLHCYSSSLEMAYKFVEMGAMLGISGVVTFSNGKKLQEIVKEIPLEHLLIETDSPFLTPVPFRGQQNEPKNVLFVAQKIAQIKDLTLEKVLKITTDNAIRQFDLKVNL